MPEGLTSRSLDRTRLTTSHENQEFETMFHVHYYIIHITHLLRLSVDYFNLKAQIDNITNPNPLRFEFDPRNFENVIEFCKFKHVIVQI